MAEDFVGRVYRIEIGYDVADYLVGVLELFDRMRGQTMPALPPRLRAIHRSLAEACTGVNDSNASPEAAGQPCVTGVDASTKAVAALDMPHSEPRRVDTSAAAQMLQMTTNGVRDRCREDKLDSVKIGPQYAITVESIEKYKVQHPRRKRARD